jgi:hypothetical protein
MHSKIPGRDNQYKPNSYRDVGLTFHHNNFSMAKQEDIRGDRSVLMVRRI